jgi:hypothetical protein
MMGHLVVVTTVYRKETRYVPNGLHTRQMSYLVQDLPAPRTGWYVGERNLRTGKVIPGGEGEGAYFDGRGNIKAHAVVFWPTMAPVLVPHGCMNMNPFEHTSIPPHPPGKSPRERDEARKQYRDNPGAWTRDPKTGRFV